MADALTTIVTFLGGGIIGAAIHWAATFRAEREKRHSNFIYAQLDKLYGPLYFLSSQNEELFKLCKNILGSHREYFDGKSWSEGKWTQDRLEKQSTATIELSNEYIGQVVKNNEEIVDILKTNYAFSDADDLGIFQEFVNS